MNPVNRAQLVLVILVQWIVQCDIVPMNELELLRHVLTVT